MRSYPAFLVYARCWYVFKMTMIVFYQNMSSQTKMVVKAVSATPAFLTNRICEIVSNYY